MFSVIFNDAGMSRSVFHLTDDGMTSLCGRDILIGDAWSVPEDGVKVKNAINCQACQRVDEKRNAPPEEKKKRPFMYMGHRLDR